ncbi:MAG: PHP domain-containing protein [Clostridia bacterium]|nr:PHP domain-containing protein [Clostridia bacterium]
MKKYLLPEGKTAFKANLHCHSTLSDGRNDVATLKKEYLKRGYSVVAFSDHNCLIPHPELNSPDFVPLTAIEIDVNGPKGHTYHLNFFSPEQSRNEFPPIERIYGTEGVNKLIATGNDAGFLCQYNHPRWSFQTPEEFVGLKGLWGFEVFNTGCEVDMHDGWGDYEYEVMCRDGSELPCATATDDNHNGACDFESPYDDSFGGWTTFFASSLSYDNAFNALKRGDCYATTGPEFKGLYVEDGKIYIDCTPVSSVCIRFETRRSGRMTSFGDEITHAEFDVSGGYQHFRVELKDSHGNKALSRAYSKAEVES